MDADGSRLMQLVPGRGRWQGSPRWSPDGRRVAFEWFSEEGFADVWTVEVAGGSPRRVTHGPLSEGTSSWSPDGRYIYYREDRADGSDIWRVPEVGGTAERLTEKGGYNPLMLADGRTLLYTRGRYEAPLIARDLEDRTETQIVDCVQGRNFDSGPSGLFYVGCSADPLGWPLYRLDAATGERRVLTRIAATNLDGIAVSPLGWPVMYVEMAAEANVMLIESFR